VQLSDISAYEIHMGQLSPLGQARPLFQLLSRNGEAVNMTDGAVNRSGNVVGTLLHGLFTNAPLRAGLLGRLRQLRGKPEHAPQPSHLGAAQAYDQLAATVRESLDQALLYRLARVSRRTRPGAVARVT
jgi:adenosylcobyric acid synthase